MIPGFGALSNVVASDQPVLFAIPSATVRLALWETPSPTTCRFARTDTFCTGLVMWCKDVFVCSDANSPLGHEETRTPYPCGVCVGISSPDDW